MSVDLLTVRTQEEATSEQTLTVETVQAQRVGPDARNIDGIDRAEVSARRSLFPPFPFPPRRGDGAGKQKFARAQSIGYLRPSRRVFHLPDPDCTQVLTALKKSRKAQKVLRAGRG